jgi:hypothetical protein
MVENLILPAKWKCLASCQLASQEVSQFTIGAPYYLWPSDPKAT